MIDINKLNSDIKYKLYPSVNINLLNKNILNFINKKFIPLNKKYNLGEIPPEEFLDKFDIKLINTDMNCGGYFDGYKNILAVKSLKKVDDKEFKETLCHELGHYIQFQTEYFEKMERLTSQSYYAEQQAETIGQLLYSILYPKEIITFDMFNGYFHIESLKFLIDWFDGYDENDLFIF